MATAIQDHQPQPTPIMELATSHSVRERNGSKSDTESARAVPQAENEPPPPEAEPRLAVLERIPTYLQPSLPWRDRLLHFTFAWYTVTYAQPLPFSSSNPRPHTP